MDLVDDDELDAIEMPEDFEPFLAETPLWDSETTQGIQLLWAPAPFNCRSGKTRRAYDIP